MTKLILRGKKRYIKRMYKHLRKEHPSTKKRMKIVRSKKKFNIHRGERRFRKGFKHVFNDY